jgi:hypothetical protein
MNHWQEDALHFSFHFKAKQQSLNSEMAKELGRRIG